MEQKTLEAKLNPQEIEVKLKNPNFDRNAYLRSILHPPKIDRNAHVRNILNTQALQKKRQNRNTYIK
jgi:hypothetical protein